MTLFLLLACIDLGEPVDPITEADADTDADSDTDADTDSDTDTDIEVVSCDADFATGDDLCVVTAGSDLLALRGNVIGPDALYEGGTVLIENGTIQCVGCDCDVADATLVECADGVISPGLINLHDHISYTEGWPIDIGTKRYDHRHEWRDELSTPSNKNGLGKAWGEIRMIMAGTTSMIGSGSASGMVRNLDRSSDNEGAGVPEINNSTFPLGDSNTLFRRNCGWNYSDGELSVANEQAFLPHIAEGVDGYAAEEFFCTSTSFAGGQNFVQSNVGHIHAIGLQATDYYRMVVGGTGLVWSPRSNISLYGHTAQVRLFDQLGGQISLSTDWTYSGSISLSRELACVDSYNRDYLDGHFNDAAMYRMVTENPADLIGADRRLGRLEADLIADVAVWDGRDAPWYRAIIEPPPAGAALVLRGGEALYGHSSILVGLGSDCEGVEVCGEQRRICAEQEFGESFATIEGELSAAYPAFFCDGPTDEPTCVPSRPSEYDSTSETDSDGDGIDDADDSCPMVFNPPRPIDGGVQPDQDGDGEGDACDATPLTGDLDGDGYTNEEDNCPFEANAEQADSDADGTGDTCDFCPDVFSEQVCPEVTATIEAIQKEEVAEGTGVQVSGVVVTALSSVGFMAQDPNASAPEYSGLYVYLGAEPQVSLGDVVTVEGTVTEYFGETEIVSSGFTVTGTGTITATDLTASDAADEKWEGVLVTITDATVSDPAYDCSVDSGSCSDANLWELNGTLVVFDRMYLDADWNDWIASGEVTGVLGYRFDRRRLMPRTASDFNPL